MSKAKASAMAMPLNQVETIRHLALDACRDSANSLDTIHWYFMQLANLFSAIRALDSDKLSNASMLAELGEHLSNDWAGFVDCSKDVLRIQEESIQAVSVARGVQS